MKSKLGKQKKTVCIIKSVSREKHSKSNAELKSHIFLKKKLKKERQFEDEVIQSQEDQVEKCNFDTALVENSRENSEEKLKQTKKCSKKHEYKGKIKENSVESSGNDQDEISSKKRKRSREKKKTKNLESSIDNSNHGIITEGEASNKSIKGILNGLVIAVSTLDVKGKQHESDSSSYKAVVSLCKSLGASISGQVHQRVYAVICNRSAVSQRTQRIRKAQKKRVLLLDVEWVRQCKLQRKRIKTDPYLLDFPAVEDAEKYQPIKQKQENQLDNNVHFFTNEEEQCINVESTGWTAPVQLDCCCVCHENGDENCKWCVSCNVTLAKNMKKKITS